MADQKNDIEKYLKGELTPAQMHALEKEALNDPFLADALEGIQPLQPAEFDNDVNELQAALSRRIQKKNANGLGWITRIAAGLIILGASTYLIFIISDRKEKSSENLALNKQQEIESEVGPKPEVDDNDLQAKEEEASSPSDASSEQPKEATRGQSAVDELRESKPLSREEQQSQPTEQVVAAPADPEQDEVLSEKLEEGRTLAETETLPEIRDQSVAEKKRELKAKDDIAESSRSKSAAGAPAQAFSNNANRRVVKGQVTFSEDGTALPGVNVMVKGSNEGTVTDAQGNYQLPVTEAQPELVFSFIGFSSKEIPVTSDQLNVSLEADVSELSEVVVVGYGESTTPFTPNIMELATPAGGRKAFKQYLEQNLKYPEEALKNQVEGKVTVQFTIDVGGQLSDFKVVRGIGHGCDEEVIRLIKSGPKWAPSKKNDVPMKDRARVRMRFSLPKK
jgi:TonB family protein